jgi:hypothetical protein
MLIPDEPCQYCDATGVRTDTVGVCEGMPTRELDVEDAQALGRTHGWCNACCGKGTVEPWARNYSLLVEDVREFAVFLSYCGGFQIC